jgi:hypothetical protein
MTDQREVITGTVRRPRNRSAHATGSIHDDATATALGFRGGTVAGSIHMDQFPPVLLEAFGPRWFETGSLSLYFRHATLDGEPVQAFVERPADDARDGQVRAWATTADDVIVADGTASAGAPAGRSALFSRDLRPADPAELRILKALRPGDALGRAYVPPSGPRQRSIIESDTMTEPLDWYTAASPWGGPVASPSAVVDLLYAHSLDGVRATTGPHVGLFGAIEIRFEAGPVFLDRHYHVGGAIAAVSQTPKTEVLWFDTRARDDSGTVIAQMRMMLRMMKQSSPLYQGRDQDQDEAAGRPA